ncbi:16906_t:CDS:2, partial [Funneliformis caledonium]
EKYYSKLEKHLGMFLNYKENTYVKHQRIEFPLDVKEVQNEDFFSIILVTPHLFVNVIETEQ